MDYKMAGVDVEAGYRAVDLMKEYVARTNRPEVMGGLGGFAGAFDLSAAKMMRHPVLLSGTDGVGTKLKLAFLADRHDTVGIDCVAMCVNDIAVAGGEALFFLDYIACGKNEPEKIAQIVKGVAEGCVRAGCALIGGETAEMPGFYAEDEYDLAGFVTGIAERDEMIDGSGIVAGDVLIGVASTGLHSNGFSLVRKVLDLSDSTLHAYSEALSGTLIDTLLTPTGIYTGVMRAFRDKGVRVKGASHITGGGFYENVPRMLPEGMHANITKDAFPHPAVFDLIRKQGALDEDVLYHTFNMGVGLVVAVPEEDADKALAAASVSGDTAYVIGCVTSGEKGVTLR